MLMCFRKKYKQISASTFCSLCQGSKTFSAIWSLYHRCFCFCRCSRFRCSRTSSAQWTWLAVTPTWTRAPSALTPPRRAPDHRAPRTTRPSRRASSSSCSPSDNPTPSALLIPLLLTSTPPPRRSVHQTHCCLCLTFWMDGWKDGCLDGHSV